MIELDGLISVAEASKRLKRSQEQVRRYLREGKLRGQRIGNQWFVEEQALAAGAEPAFQPLIPYELMNSIRVFKASLRGRHLPDPLEMIREAREANDDNSTEDRR